MGQTGLSKSTKNSLSRPRSSQHHRQGGTSVSRRSVSWISLHAGHVHLTCGLCLPRLKTTSPSTRPTSSSAHETRTSPLPTRSRTDDGAISDRDTFTTLSPTCALWMVTLMPAASGLVRRLPETWVGHIDARTRRPLQERRSLILVLQLLPEAALALLGSVVDFVRLDRAAKDIG
jgi:hypothetical protein